MQYQPLPGYTSTRPATSQVVARPVNNWASVVDYTALAQAADRERLGIQQRDAQRQNAVIGGYDAQMLNSRNAGNDAYGVLQGNYDAIAADAAATRARNMARVDQYGGSMRQDLAIKNQQALAAANQSAIKRGLGNTTIADSLARGVNFDNTRQQMALEDQLLQNRIATDSNLSGAYQGVLANRAGALNQQANQNISNDNGLAQNRLGYIGGIQENMDGFNTVANLYSQQLQMENANQQADLDRQLRIKQMSSTPAYTMTVGGSLMKPATRIQRGWN